MAKLAKGSEKSKNLIDTFNCLKQFPCLYDPGHKDYSNKKIKQECYENVLEVFKRENPTATLRCLKKKLGYCRSSYRRYRKRVEDAMVNGEVFEPNLWYYKYLTFLSGDNDCKSNNDSDNDSETDQPPKPKKRRLSATEDKQKTKTKQNVTKVAKMDSISLFGLCIAKQISELDKQDRDEVKIIISDVLNSAKAGTLEKYASKMDTPQDSAAEVDEQNDYVPEVDTTSVVPQSNVYEASVIEHAEVDAGLFIPRAEPSWYDTPW